MANTDTPEPRRPILEPGQTPPKSVVVLYAPLTTATAQGHQVRLDVKLLRITIKK